MNVDFLTNEYFFRVWGTEQFTIGMNNFVGFGYFNFWSNVVGFHLALNVFEKIKIILTKIVFNFMGVGVDVVFKVGFRHGYIVHKNSGEIILGVGVDIF